MDTLDLPYKQGVAGSSPAPPIVAADLARNAHRGTIVYGDVPNSSPVFAAARRLRHFFAVLSAFCLFAVG